MTCLKVLHIMSPKAEASQISLHVPNVQMKTHIHTDMHPHTPGPGVCVILADSSFIFTKLPSSEALMYSSCISSFGKSGKKSRRMISLIFWDGCEHMKRYVMHCISMDAPSWTSPLVQSGLASLHHIIPWQQSFLALVKWQGNMMTCGGQLIVTNAHLGLSQAECGSL